MYLITGRELRSDLRSLCCCCCTSAAAAAGPATAASVVVDVRSGDHFVNVEVGLTYKLQLFIRAVNNSAE